MYTITKTKIGRDGAVADWTRNLIGIPLKFLVIRF